MATVTKQIYQSDLEGSSISIFYDDVLLTASGLHASCQAKAIGDLVVSYTISGTPFSHTVSRGTAITTITFAIPLTIQLNVPNTSKFGGTLTVFEGLEALGASHSVPSAVAVAV